MADTSPCPAGCGRVQQPGKLLCRPCWLTVPEPVQREVYRTWRVYRKADFRRDPEGFRAASKAYRHARDAAIANVR